MPLQLRSPFFPFLHPNLSLSTLRLVLPLTSSRAASHAAQGRANKAAPGPGKRLGAKKSSQQYVVPGNIIFRQRGTHWYPGENCGMGRDHTIFAKEKGYVVFYKDPEQLSLGVGNAGYGGGVGGDIGGNIGDLLGGVRGKRKVREKRKYIGVVMERGQTLPRGRGARRPRRLGMDAREMSTLAGPETTESTGEVVSNQVPQTEDGAPAMRDESKEARSKVPEKRKLELRPGYMYREANWEIGRVETKEKKGYRVYTKGDRFLAWRKKTKRLAKAAEKRTLRGQGKKKTGGR
ncbi:MAG: hypothetical protein Q9207_004788 [Kuettlingeria erythrocarpa]